jgi:hypothetical protein
MKKIEAFVLLIVILTVYSCGQKLEENSDPQITIDNPPLGEFSGHSVAKSLAIPDSLFFAGEQVPLDVPDVRERLDRELHINTYWHNNTIFLIKHANRWLPQMEPILREYGIPDDFKYLTAIEGSFRNDKSPSGAVGYWQILKETGKEFGLEVTKEVDERYDPIKSTVAACKYLNRAYKKFGNWTNVAGSYNRGMAGLQRAITHQNDSIYYNLLLNEETSRYVFRILAIKEIIENPEKYSFNIESEHLYQEEKIRYVEVNKSIKDLVQWSIDQGINYKLLKRHNPWLRKDKLTVRKGKSYQIAIPQGS